MLKKMMMLATMAVAAAAFLVPSMANADPKTGIGQWSENTKVAALEKNVTFTVTDANFAGGIGGTTCPEAHSNTTLIPGSTATVNSFTVANPAGCTTSGLLGGCTLTSVTSTTPWTAHATTSNIHITNVKIHNTYHGGFCPYHELTLKGEITVTPDNTHHVSTGTISGSLTVYNGTTTAHIQTVEASGSVHITPAGVYGLTPTLP